MTKANFKLRSVVAIAICLAGIAIFSSCGKDDKNDNPGNEIPGIEDVKVGVELVNGNVVNTIKISLTGYGDVIEKTIYVYKSGVFDHVEKEETWASKQLAQIAYEEEKNYPSYYYESVTLDGNTVKIVFKKSYSEGERYESMTAQEWYEELKEIFKNM